MGDPHDRPIDLLRGIAPFDAFEEPLLEELAPHVSSVHLEGGRALLREGELGEAVYVLLSGRLAVVASGRPERRLSELARGAIVGELAVMTGERRSATVQALEACELVAIAGRGFRRLVSRHRDAFQELISSAAQTLRRAQTVAHLSAAFGDLDADALRDLGDEVEWVSLPAGEVLFREGDPGDAAYVVASGRLRVTAGGPPGEWVLNEVGRGEIIGEMALLTDHERSATLYAVRDSQLIRLSESAFEKIVEKRPQAMRQVAGMVIERLRRRERGGRRAAPAPATLVVIPTGPGRGAADFAAGLVAALGSEGRVLHLDRAGVDGALGLAGIADAQAGDPAAIRLGQWLDEREAIHDWIVYEADARWSPWTERAVRQADQVLLVARAGDGPGLGAVEARLAETWNGRRAPRHSLVLLWGEGEAPAGTGRWLAVRPHVERHHHVRAGSAADIARIARRLAGRAVGLVLGGGGARGLAHLGVLRALEELEVPVDAIGGTSMGAIIAGMHASGLDAAEAREACRRYLTSIFDPTLPLVSLLVGRRIGARLQEAFGEVRIEDLPIPYYCVATDLSNAAQVVHGSGPLWPAVRSSISLPGILPPVSHGGRLLVDGGLLNNVPVDVMTEFCDGGRVVAVDVSPDEDLRSRTDLPSAVSGWKLLLRRLSLFPRPPELPSVLQVLTRSAVVASLVADRARNSARSASLYLKVPVTEWSLLEFESLPAIVARGYEASRAEIAAWWSEEDPATVS